MLHENSRTDKGECQFLTFSSGEDFAATVKALPMLDSDKHLPREFGITFEEANERARSGRADLVPASDTFLTKIERLIDFASSGFESVASVAGGVPVVPSMLAGNPVHMRVRRRTVTDRNPVAIFADAWVQFGVENDMIERRGAAALALARLLAMQRPVKLYVTCGHGARNPIIWTMPIETAPLDVQRAAWALCSPDVLRIHGHRLLHAHVPGDAGYKAYMDEAWQKNEMPKLIAARLGVSDFISLPGLSWADRDAFWRDDETAVNWIRAQVERYNLDD